MGPAADFKLICSGIFLFVPISKLRSRVPTHTANPRKRLKHPGAKRNADWVARRIRRSLNRPPRRANTQPGPTLALAGPRMLGAHEEGFGKDIAQPRKHPALGRLRVAEARRRTRNVRSLAAR